MFGSIGVSYREANADLRGKVAFTPETARAFREAAARTGVAQVMTLSTCNRTEVFFFGDAKAPETVRRLFRTTFPFDAVERSGRDALAYLFRVAAGLESMVLGEYQILGQVKEAYATALASGHVGRELDRILRDAISAAKRVKTELDIGAVPPSVCRAGMNLVDATVGLAGRRVFVIGSGKTGSLAVSLARERGAAAIAVCNRSPERVQRLVDAFGVTPVDYAARAAQIAASDIVVSATASPHVVVKADDVRLVHPVCFLDLAVPRDVDPALADNPLVTLLGIDAIGTLAEGDRREREGLVARGEVIINSAVDNLLAWLAAPPRR